MNFSLTDIDLHAAPVSAMQIIINDGIKSKTLLDNPIFAQACRDLYLALVNEEDNLTLADNLDKVENLRIERRILRQLIGNLEARIMYLEQFNEQQKANQLDKGQGYED